MLMGDILQPQWHKCNVGGSALFVTDGRNKEFVLFLLYMIFQTFNEND